MTFLRMSTSSITIILLIILIRLIAMHKLPKRAFLVLWSVVLLRLLVPVLIPSKLSLYTFLYEHNKSALQGGYSNQGIYQFSDFSILNLFRPIIENKDAVPFLLLIWLAGVLICAAIFVIPYFKRIQEYRSALPIETAYVKHWITNQKTRIKFRVLQSDLIISPITYGVFRPVILLPKTTDWNDTVTLDYILTHEFVHIKTSDLLLKWLLMTALCLHWFNPAVWIMTALANRDIELACDETVVKTFGETIKSLYALTLIELEEKKFRLAPLASGFSLSATEERIISIMKTKKHNRTGLFIAVLLIMLTAVVFTTEASVTAPNLVGKPLEEVQQILEDNNLTYIIQQN